MNVEKITAVMDKFEKQFENLDLTSGVMESAIQQSTAQTTPETQVEALMAQVADEHGLEFESGLVNAPNKKLQTGQEKQESKQQEKEKVAVLSEEESLEDRLRKLQGL